MPEQRYKGDHKKAANKMEEIRAKRYGSIGKLGQSIKNFFSKEEAKKKKRKVKVDLDREKVSGFKAGFFGRNKDEQTKKRS